MEASDLHPNKRLRSQSPSPSPPPSAKGKERIEDVTVDSDGEPVCGICLSEGGRSVRGNIDICDHFFCFVCIMEWARIESRCPTCKQRFRSIRRPRVPGLFACERVVDVPHRDQVYHPLGNESTALSDPYEHTNCNTCNSSSNENLLLLCDLCDSAAHTYCVGLGFTVPEGRDAASEGKNRAVDNTAKEEVQSLVKLNLTLLSREQRLSIEQFKDIARVSTHTILAACGFEVHSKSVSNVPFLSSICRHTEEMKSARKSSLMTDSCRECFYAFVKNVVDSVMSGKIQPVSR